MMQPNDNVATALEEIQAGDDVAAALGKECRAIRAAEAIPFGFKIALQDIPQGDLIRKYGEVIGRASTAIARGTMVHIHNLEGTRARGDLERRAQA
jgi:altronate dehydratase small subunit